MLSQQRIKRRHFLQGAAALLAGGSALSLAACGRDGNALTWYVNDDPVRNPWEYKVAIPQFKQLHPEIDLQLVSVPWSEFDPKLTNLVIAGIAPDVWCQWGASGYTSCAWRDIVINQSALIQRDQATFTDYYPGALKFGTWAGQQVGVPLDLGGTYCFYNKDLFDKAHLPYPAVDWDDNSWNWNEMVRYAQELSHDYDDITKAVYGITWQVPIEEVVWLWGGDVYEKSAYTSQAPHKSHWNTPAAIEALQSYADLINVKKVMPSAAITNALSSGGDPFTAGRVAMTISGIWGFGSYASSANFRWGAAAVPGMYSKRTGVYADPMMISTQSKQQDAAWEFIKYLISDEGARGFMQASAWPVPNTTVLPEWYKQFKTMQPSEVKTVFEGQLKYGQMSADNLLIAYDRISSITTSELDPVMKGTAQAKDVAPGLDQQLDRLFQRLRP